MLRQPTAFTCNTYSRLVPLIWAFLVEAQVESLLPWSLWILLISTEPLTGVLIARG